MKDRTIFEDILISGIGLHSGKTSYVRLNNATPTVRSLSLGSGIYFSKNDDIIGKVTPKKVVDTSLSTNIVINELENSSINTIEHLMAALWAYNITSIRININNNDEIPILDGSSKPWCELIHKATTKSLYKEIPPIIITDTIRVEHGDSFLEVLPYDGFSADITIDFPYKSIGRQRYVSELTPTVFKDELSFCRTFVHINDVTQLKMMGKALGGSFDNAIVVNDNKVLNPDGLRVKNEFVKHKVLDMVGDLWTLGRPIKGKITGYKPGHTINNLLARKLHKLYEGNYVC